MFVCLFVCVVQWPEQTRPEGDNNSSLNWKKVYKRRYKEIHEKDSGGVVSVVCYTIYTVYLLLYTQAARTTPPEPFSWIALYINYKTTLARHSIFIIYFVCLITCRTLWKAIYCVNICKLQEKYRKKAFNALEDTKIEA